MPILESTTEVSRSLGTGRFGAYGGRYVPETLMAALLEFWRGLSAVQDVYSMRAGA